MSENSECWQQRTELLLGKEKAERLNRSHVLIVGVGGVGAYAAEMLCRAGVGSITIVDSDLVQKSNINRQILAMNSTLGCLKVQVRVGKRRLLMPRQRNGMMRPPDGNIYMSMLPVGKNVPKLPLIWLCTMRWEPGLKRRWIGRKNLTSYF